jgi:magnesium-transporting ATPase (P-type)
MPRLNFKKGFVLMISVLIISAIVLSISIMMVFVNINASRSRLDIRNSDQSRMLANACSEMALSEIALGSGISSDTIIFEEGSCFYNISSVAGGTIIRSQANFRDFVKREELLLSSTSPIVIDYWQEVSGF